MCPCPVSNVAISFYIRCCHFGDRDLQVVKDKKTIVVRDSDDSDVQELRDEVGEPLLARQQGIEADQKKASDLRAQADRSEREVMAIQSILETQRQRAGRLFVERIKPRYQGGDVLNIACVIDSEKGPMVVIQRAIREEATELGDADKELLLAMGKQIAARGGAKDLPTEVRTLLGLPSEEAPQIACGDAKPDTPEHLAV